jgi:hypothetical protein
MSYVPSIRDIKDALQFIGRLHKLLDIATVENQEIRIKCPESRGQYSVAVKVKSGVFRRVRTLRFPFPQLVRLEVRSLPIFRDENHAVTHVNSEFIVNLDALSDNEHFLFDFEFRLDDDQYLRSLVHRDHQREQFDGDQDKYWMQAQLKHLKVLETNYGVVDLRDLDLLVDVGIHQELKTAIPKPFVESMELAAKLLREPDRNRKLVLAAQHAKQKRRIQNLKDDEVLSGIQDFFTSAKFSRYLSVGNPFRFSEAARGTEFYDNIPFPVFPKSMRVVSRTDLSLRKPVAEGHLVYRKMDLQKEMADLFPKAFAKDLK